MTIQVSKRNASDASSDASSDEPPAKVRKTHERVVWKETITPLVLNLSASATSTTLGSAIVALPIARPTSSQVYIMHLAGGSEREAFIRKQLQGAGYADDDFRMFETRKPSYDLMRKYADNGSLAPNRVPSKRRPEFKSGEVGHYMALHAILDDAALHDYDTITIFEDDAVLPAGFKSELEDLVASLPTRGLFAWDVFSPAWSKDGINTGEEVPNHPHVVVPSPVASFEKRRVFVGTECLVFTRRSIRKIRDHMFPMLVQTDKFLDMLKNIGYINLLVTKKALTFQNEEFASNIQ
jgi:GR25 family glycosyltransferase involved in LPS biosynthesis